MKLNEKPIREKYKEFYGKNTEQMELLIKDNRIPLTIKQIIERRLNSTSNDWKTNYFDSCDAVVYGEKGKFKIVKNSKILRKMTSKTKLIDGAIKIKREDYKKIKEKEFNLTDTKETIWHYLLDELYEPYIKLLGYCPDFYFSNLDEYCIRALFAYWLVYWSRLIGGYGLDYVSGRLVGLASEMQEEMK